MGADTTGGENQSWHKDQLARVRALDIYQDLIIQRYEERGKQITKLDQGVLHYLRDKILTGRFDLPLVPFYLCKILDEYQSRDDGTSPQQGSDDILSGSDIMGSSSFSSMVCRDPALGLHIFNFAKQLFFRKDKNISYDEVFRHLSWEHYEYLFALIFKHIPLFTSYKDLAEFQKNWEFSSIGALVATRLATVMKLDEKDAEEIFLTILLSDIGKAALYWELPVFHGAFREEVRRIRNNPLTQGDIKYGKGKYTEYEGYNGCPVEINAALFREIMWHWHPMVSAKIAAELGINDRVVRNVMEHHHHIGQVSQNMRIVKFVYYVSDRISKYGLCHYERDFVHLKSKRILCEINLSDALLEDFINNLCDTHFGILEESVVDPFMGSEPMTTGYHNPDPLAEGFSRVLEADGLHYQVNLLQLAKDKIHEFTISQIFPVSMQGGLAVSKFRAINLLNAVIAEAELGKAAANLELTEQELEQELDKIQIPI